MKEEFIASQYASGTSKYVIPSFMRGLRTLFNKNCNIQSFAANLETHIRNEKYVCYHLYVKKFLALSGYQNQISVIKNFSIKRSLYEKWMKVKEKI